jgi:hypothetical protein
MANIFRTKDISLFIFTSTVPRDEKCGNFVCWNKMCVLSVTEARNYKHLCVVIFRYMILSSNGKVSKCLLKINDFLKLFS